MKELSKHFKVDYNYYNRYFRENHIDMGINTKNMIQFLVRLPLYIPIDEDFSFSVNGDKGKIEIFLFYSTNVKDLLFTSSVSTKSISYDKKYTVVEMMYVSDEIMNSDEEKLNQVFDLLLEKVNELILSILIYNKDYDIYRINTKMLEPCIMYRHIDLETDKEINSGIFLLNQNIYVNQSIITKDDMLDILWFSQEVISKNKNPFITSEELMLSSFRQRDNGLCKEAIMLTQASVESFLRTLYKQLLVEENTPQNEIDEKIKNIPFMSIIKKELSCRIGGNWNVESYSAVGNWYRNTYEVRNRVAHGGLNPNMNQVQSAIDAANQLRAYTLQQLKSKSKKYSNILIYLDKNKKYNRG